MNTQKAPIITVIIVTYKRNDLLPRAIDSVLAQSYKDFELLIVDNNEKTPSARIVLDAYQDNRIRYITKDSNLDCAGGKNLGIKNSRGIYVAFLDDDDYWLPEKLAIQMKEFAKYPEAGFSYTAVKNIYDKQVHIATVPDGCKNYYERALRRYNGFLSGTLLIRKEVLEKVGLLDETFPSHTDIEHIIRITKVYKGIAINKPLLVMKMDSAHKQMGSSLSRKIKGREMILKKYAEEYRDRPESFALVNFRLGIFYRDSGDYKNARKKFFECTKKDFKFRYLSHFVSMFFGACLYKNIKKWRTKKNK